jgi:hypothetical protein
MESFKQKIGSGHGATPKPKSNHPIPFICYPLLFNGHLKNLTLVLRRGLSCDKSLPGTEKAECLEQLSHHYAHDILLRTFLQTETCYSFIEVNSLDAGANIAHSYLSNSAFLAALSQSHPNSTPKSSHPTGSLRPLQTGLHPKQTLDRGLLTFWKGSACQ